MNSFIVPAHNEQACLGRTLQAIHASAQAAGQPYEIIVVSDASTDTTAEVSRQHGATVLSVAHRQIAATRNSGARAARGERLFFVDADTRIHARALRSALRALEKGAVGGGVPAWVDKTEIVPVRHADPHLLLAGVGCHARRDLGLGAAFRLVGLERQRVGVGSPS
jgi:cellulose synthase/poly-beta-1,6-N-acetylglucosamine synthase-like glycosyltransferase